MCSRTVRCGKCRRGVDRRTEDGRILSAEQALSRHVCYDYKCNVCRDMVGDDHQCFVKRKEPKEFLKRFMFFDIETDQSVNGEHKPNFISACWYEERATTERRRGEEGDDEEEEELLKDDRTWRGEWCKRNFSGYSALKEFVQFLFSTVNVGRGESSSSSRKEHRFKNYNVIAHNFRGFDGIFILRELIENCVVPDVILNGLKILTLTVPGLGLRFLDSFNFFPMALAKLPEAFGLSECGSKGYFPHFFNTPENQDCDRIGLPDKKYYGMESMLPKAREAFEKWYDAENAKNVRFVFRDEIARYCEQDVWILKESCMAYRRLMCEEVECDPFNYITCASVCNAVYQTRFMPPEKIARVPPAGYVRTQQSMEALEWLEYLRRFEGVPDMHHAGNSNVGEKTFGRYRVDGYSPSRNVAYEYYGCWYHGCPKCFPKEKRSLQHPDTHLRLDQAYNRTLERERELKTKYGLSVVSIWGCDWANRKRDGGDAMKTQLVSMDVQALLKPMEAFFGGRTEAFKLALDRLFTEASKQLLYADINSLYPSTMVSRPYPVGHPKVIVGNFKELDEYFGLVKCRVLPPKDLYLPVLPMHCGPHKKLVFPLCRSCAESFQTAPCRHSDDERALLGTWFTEEVKLAVSKGYRVLRTYSVFHFEETSTDLFKSYIKMFYKRKLQSSKLPFHTEEEVQRFLAEVYEKEGIELEPSDFRENPGLRQLTKLMLNNLWGRYGMRQNKTQTKFVTNFQQLRRLSDDRSLEITGMRVVTENVVQVAYRKATEELVPTSLDTNIFIAVCTTAWARIRLYRDLDHVGERAVYCDTDSLIYAKSADPERNVKTGLFLGEMSNELDDDDYIEDYVSGGPKNYGYRTKKGKVTVKVKGFSLNSVNAPALSFRNIKEIVLNSVRFGSDENYRADSDEEDDVDVLASLDRRPPRKPNRDPKTRDKANRALRQQLLQEHVGRGRASAVLDTNRGAISTLNEVRIFRSRDWRVLQKPDQKLYTFWFDKRIILNDYDTIPYGFSEDE